MKDVRGYTLIELLVVMAIIATLLSLVAPRYFHSLELAREVALRTNLKAIRVAIDRFHGDMGRYPESVAVLVEQRYLRESPVDPMTERADTWVEIVVPCVGERDALGLCQKLTDVRSGAKGVASDGTEYARW